jgi:hypothetical protein
MLVVTQVLGQLGLQRGLEHRLGESRQQPARANQVDTFGARSGHQLLGVMLGVDPARPILDEDRRPILPSAVYGAAVATSAIKRVASLHRCCDERPTIAAAAWSWHRWGVSAVAGLSVAVIWLGLGGVRAVET